MRRVITQIAVVPETVVTQGTVYALCSDSKVWRITPGSPSAQDRTWELVPTIPQHVVDDEA